MTTLLTKSSTTYLWLMVVLVASLNWHRDALAIDCAPADPACPPTPKPSCPSFGSFCPGVMVDEEFFLRRTPDPITYSAWTAWGPWGDKCGWFGWIRARSRTRTATYNQITRCWRLCLYRYSVPARDCEEFSEIDAITQACSFTEDDYDYAFFDPPPGMPAAGTYDLDDPTCSAVFSFGQMTFDWSFITADATVAGYTASFNGTPVSDGVPISLGDSVGVQTAGLHVNYVGGSSENWTFHFTTTAPTTIAIVQPPPAAYPGRFTEAILSVKNNLSRETPLQLTISQPTGWTTLVLGDDVPAVGPGGQIQVRLGIKPPANSGNGTFPLTFTAVSAQGKQRTLVVPVQVSTTVDVEVGSSAGNLSLLLNTPNPMRSITRISYALPRSTWATLAIYDLSGRSVKRIFSGHQERGSHQVTWDGTDEMGREVPAGVYVYALEVGPERLLRKLLVVR